MSPAEWRELLTTLATTGAAGVLLILAGAVDTSRARTSRIGRDTPTMPEPHDPSTCSQCTAQRAELRHPMYRRTRRLLSLPGQRGGAA